ncbi:MAG: holo-ACP synthase [Candidatus Hydrothermae bacterium]|nr:holo-ACP synthase [Candidatus Hydrothermae bacterium]
MIVGIGLDLIEVSRIRRAVDRFGRRFLQRIYAPEEVAYARKGEDFFRELAARFAAKEAFVKALGTGFTQGIRHRDIVVLNHPSGMPYLVLKGPAARRARGYRSHISLTHLRDLASAICVLEAEP